MYICKSLLSVTYVSVPSCHTVLHLERISCPVSVKLMMFFFLLLMCGDAHMECKDRPHEVYSLVGKNIVISNYKCGNVCFKEVVCCGIYNGVLSLVY